VVDYGLYGLHDIGVGGAAAQVARQVVTDVVRRWLRVSVQQFLGHENEAGGAEAALECAVLNKRFLDRMELIAGGQSLDGSHFGSIDKSGQEETTADSNAVHQRRTAATESLPATLACSKKAEIPPQNFEQGFMCGDFGNCRAAVQLESDGPPVFFSHKNWQMNKSPSPSGRG
jgi:hypothetical protein